MFHCSATNILTWHEILRFLKENIIIGLMGVDKHNIMLIRHFHTGKS